MPDVPARIGVPVWRWPRTHNRPGHDYRDFYVTDDEPGLWFASSPEAVAEMRERIDNVIHAYTDTHGVADAILQALGFTDA